jgi:hypothetical protein
MQKVEAQGPPVAGSGHSCTSRKSRLEIVERPFLCLSESTLRRLREQSTIDTEAADPRTPSPPVRAARAAVPPVSSKRPAKGRRCARHARGIRGARRAR